MVSYLQSFCLLPLVVIAAAYEPQVHLVRKFPVGTWIENLAIRQNGNILATSATTPQLYEVDPAGKYARIIATIPRHLALAGIAEVEPDVFYVNANNFSIKTLTPQANASAVYRLDLQRKQPILVTSFDDSILLNGMTRCGDSHNLLVGDSGRGQIWLLDTKTGNKQEVIANDLTKVKNSAGEPIGVNGLVWTQKYLYWSNTNQQLLARVKIDEKCRPIGKVEHLTQYDSPDDILLNSKDVLLTGNDEIRVFSSGNVQVLSSDSLLRGSTAIRASRSKQPGVYYVSTNGGVAQYLEGAVTNPGKIVRVQLR